MTRAANVTNSAKPYNPQPDSSYVVCAKLPPACHRIEAIAEKWGYWSDGIGELHPICPECARREFGEHSLAGYARGRCFAFQAD
jgi:hypothetical protein